MNEPNIKTIRVDDDLDQYQGFFDYGWSRKLERLVKGTRLSEICFDLMVTWKGISEATTLANGRGCNRWHTGFCKS